MINKLLDEPYWVEMEAILDPFIKKIKKEESSAGIDLDYPEISSFDFVSDCLITKGLHNFQEEGIEYVVTTTKKEIFSSLETNLPKLKTFLINEIKRILELNKKHLDKKGHSSKKLNNIIKKELDFLKEENNIQLIALKYKEHLGEG